MGRGQQKAASESSDARTPHPGRDADPHGDGAAHPGRLGAAFPCPKKDQAVARNRKQAVFKLEVSLRHPDAHTLYQNMAKLVDNAIWQLIGCQIRKDGVRRSNPIQELMKMISQEGRPSPALRISS